MVMSAEQFNTTTHHYNSPVIAGVELDDVVACVPGDDVSQRRLAKTGLTTQQHHLLYRAAVALQLITQLRQHYLVTVEFAAF